MDTGSIEKLSQKLELAARFPNLKTEISLIYGLPLQTVESFQRSVSWVQRKLPEVQRMWRQRFVGSLKT